MNDDPKRELTDLLREVAHDWVMIRRRERGGGGIASHSPMLIGTYPTAPTTPAPTLQSDVEDEWGDTDIDSARCFAESLAEEPSAAPRTRACKEPKKIPHGHNPWEYLMRDKPASSWGHQGLPESEAQLRGFDSRPYPARESATYASSENKTG